MFGSQLRRTGFAAVLATGFALAGSAVHGIGGMGTSLELAAQREAPDSTMRAEHVWCPERDEPSGQRS
jgi:hypothetical protein